MKAKPHVPKIKVSIQDDPVQPSITVDGKIFGATMVKYQFVARAFQNGAPLCTFLAIGFLEGDPKKYGIVGNIAKGAFSFMDYESFCALANSEKPVKIADAKSGLLRRLIDVSPTDDGGIPQ